ncbi:MAG: 26S proteasome non-ATPase regulatory subunit 14 [Paramarteilia canceri]
MEVLGLMLGQFIDHYTLEVVDVFAMPQSGTGVAVEDIDPTFQARMLDLLANVGRPEIVVGWYHSHPGMGCWLSSTDQNTHSSFQQLSNRSVALVIDPIQSVKGKVVMDAFRLLETKMPLFGASSASSESRQTTSNNGHLNRPSSQALIHGLNRAYYSINCDYKIGRYENTVFYLYNFEFALNTK